MKDVALDIKENILVHFPEPLERCFMETDDEILRRVREIRVRGDRPVLAYCDEEYFLTPRGLKRQTAERPHKISQAEVEELFLSAVRYSPYAYEDEIKKGFITLRGGHRVGLCGTAVIGDDGAIGGLKNISSLNIRISREIKTAAREVMPYITTAGRFHSTLLLSPPGCGKTTFLRDIIRRLSDGIDCIAHTVAVADERGEIAAVYEGQAQNDVGQRTDVFDASGKAEAIMRLIRAMAPIVVATDEVGTSEDAAALAAAANCGVKLLCTAHADDVSDMLQARDEIKRKICGLFERIVVLENKTRPGEIKAVYDEKYERVK